MAEPKLVNSPVNSMKLSPPAPNAKSLKTANPKSAQPNVRGASAPNLSAPVSMPAVPGFEQPDSYHPSGGRNR
jgi:hypothetical protein